jgi:glycosyltransferase involved in cell wall biosynthesis
MPDLPLVSCLCITFGRTTLLDEAVESFLRQDYAGPKELIILNDLSALEIRGDIPGVTIVNLPRRMRTIGEKRNASVALARGDYLFPWDDDDISLPWRISVSMRRLLAGAEYFKPDRYWFLRKDGTLDPHPHVNMAHAMGAWTRRLFLEAGGYPAIQSGQDTELEHRFASTGRRQVETIPTEELFYIYRWAVTGSYHLSQHGKGQGFDQAAVAVAGVEGIHELRSHWQRDYAELI